MAIYLNTSYPSGLLSAFKKQIDNKKILTWSYDTDEDFTHSVDQWANKAWLRPKIENGRLVLFIIKSKTVNMSKTVYGIYHGRFIESMLTHCDTLFTEALATAMPVAGDIVP